MTKKLPVSLPHIKEDESFEVSEWMSQLTKRLDKIQQKQQLKQKWIRLAKSLKRMERVDYINSVHDQFVQENAKIVTRSSLQSVSVQAKRKIVQTAKTQTRIPKRPPTRAIPKPQILVTMNEPEEPKEPKEPENLREAELRATWTSMVERFTKQTFYVNLQNSLYELERQRIHDKHKHRELWESLAHHAVLNARIDCIEYAKESFQINSNFWNDFASKLLLDYKFDTVKAAHDKWASLKMRTDTEMQSFWMRAARKLRHKQRVIKMVKESMAIRTIANFVRYIMIPKRAQIVAQSMNPKLVGFGRYMAKRSVLRCARVINDAVRKRVYSQADLFAHNWSDCIADACCSVASYHVMKPEDAPQVVLTRKKKEKTTYANRIRKLEKETQKKPKKEWIPIYNNEDVCEDIETIGGHVPLVTTEIEDGEAPLQLDFEEDKNQFRTKVIVITDEQPQEDLEIAITPSRSQSSSEAASPETKKAVLEISNPSLKEVSRKASNDEILRMMAPKVRSEGIHKTPKQKHSRQRRKPRTRVELPTRVETVPERDLYGIMKMFGCESSLEELDEGEIMGETSVSEINFNFREDEPSEVSSQVEERRIQQNLLAISDSESRDPSCNMIFESDESGEQQEQEEQEEDVESLCEFRFESRSSEHECVPHVEEEEVIEEEDYDDEVILDVHSRRMSISDEDEDIICRDYSD